MPRWRGQLPLPYALLLALSGFRYCAPERRLELAPCWPEKEGRFFFAADGAWGSIRYTRQGAVLVACRRRGGMAARGRKARC